MHAVPVLRIVDHAEAIRLRGSLAGHVDPALAGIFFAAIVASDAHRRRSRTWLAVAVTSTGKENFRIFRCSCQSSVARTSTLRAPAYSIQSSVSVEVP